MIGAKYGIALALAFAAMATAPVAAQHIDAEAQAGAQALKTKAGLPADPVSTAKVDPMRGYYGNTYACYWPDVFQCRHWWNADGTENYFEARWTPEGVITMKTIEGRYKVFYANGQWCAQNARGRAPTRPAGDDAPVVRAKKNVNPLNNNDNQCAPIVDAVPGDRWYKLHQPGPSNLQGMREQYVLLPGHQ